MNIIINASNLRVGGAIQVALSTIHELKNFPGHKFHVFLSPAFNGVINKYDFERPNIEIYWVNFPSRFTYFGRVTQLDILEKKIGADCVFSIFGPSYWKPKSPHLAGFAQGYYLYSHLPFFKTLGLVDKARLFLLRNYHRILLKKHVDEFVVETNDVKLKLGNFLDMEESKIHVATNTYSSYFSNYNYKKSSKKNTSKPFFLLTVAHPYPHKNLEILKKVSDVLNREAIDYKFKITVPDSYYKKTFKGYEDSIINLGPIKNSDCPNEYVHCDAMILPSLVECFSASYPEAMKMERPILTSNYSFSTSVCGDSALYFNALDPKDIAEKIRLLANDGQLYQDLVTSGLKRLDHFLSPEERCSKYINLLLNMGGGNV